MHVAVNDVKVTSPGKMNAVRPVDRRRYGGAAPKSPLCDASRCETKPELLLLVCVDGYTDADDDEADDGETNGNTACKRKGHRSCI